MRARAGARHSGVRCAHPTHGGGDLDPAGVLLDAEEAAPRRVVDDAVANLAVVASVLVGRVHLWGRANNTAYLPPRSTRSAMAILPCRCFL